MDLFPWPKVDEEMAVPLHAGLGGADYLKLLAERLPQTLDRSQPDLVIANAGSDVLGTDPLAGLCLTPADLAERDLYVATEARRRGVPLAMVLSGGYEFASWQAHAHSIEAILARFDRKE